LLGSRGQDLLTGGVGADVFQLTLGHSGSTTSTADVITDLTMGDQIDLTGLLSLLDGVFVTSNKSSEFVGSASFVDLIGLDDDKFDVWVGSRDGRDYLVCETSADGSTTELIDIGTSASVNLSNWNFSAGVITIG
jgi:Ca2+-binding RTX toxin-like protein